MFFVQPLILALNTFLAAWLPLTHQFSFPAVVVEERM
jgi:hypothetical protein